MLDHELSAANPQVASLPSGPATPGLRQPTVKFMMTHPAHFMALGFGSGMSPLAPGTAGTLWAWLSFLALQRWLPQSSIGWLIAVSIPLGWWACTVTARNLRVLDPSCIVWDEIVAFWAVLWLISPAGLWSQAVAFALFRYFDATKPGPVGWADRLSHGMDPAKNRNAWTWAGFGIMFDDLVAAGCTLVAIALWRFFG